VGHSGADVRAWELGQQDVPKSVSRFIEWQLEFERRQAALIAAGLEQCDWMNNWEAREPAEDAEPDVHRKYLEEQEFHHRRCERCRAREHYLDEHFGKMPAPPGSWMLFVLRPLGLLNEALPQWARPPVWGAVFLLVLVLARMVWSIPLLVTGKVSPALLGKALVGAAAAGAIGGFSYSLIGRPLRRVPFAGPYLAGIAAVGGYLLGLIVGGPWALGEQLINDPIDLYVWAGGAIVFGSIFGHSAFRKQRAA
jgi:hypothetical protein